MAPVRWAKVAGSSASCGANLFVNKLVGLAASTRAASSILDEVANYVETAAAVSVTDSTLAAQTRTFLVPAGSNYQDAKREAHGRIHVIAVTSFAQALRVIRALPPR